jgi:hypothetical protein
MSGTVTDYTDEMRMAELKSVAGIFVVMLVFAIFAHKGINSLFRGMLNGIILNMLLRILIKSQGLYEYRVLKCLALEFSCVFFILEPYIFDNKYAISKEEEVIADTLMATGRSVVAYPVMVIGGIFILVTNV